DDGAWVSSLRSIERARCWRRLRRALHAYRTGGRMLSYDQSSPGELFQTFSAAVNGRAGVRHPGDQLLHALVHGAPRGEAEGALDLGDVADAVSDIPDPIAVQHLRGDVLAQQPGQDAGDLIDRDGRAAADVEHVPDLAVVIQHGGEGLGHVL